MFTKEFWLEVVERAAKSAAQFAILTVGADGFNAIDADWKLVAGAAAGGAILSLLTSVASAPIGDQDSASLV